MLVTKSLFIASRKFVKQLNKRTRYQLLAPVQINSLSSQLGNNDRTKFDEYLPCIIDCAVGNKMVAEIPGLDAWINKMLTYNLTGGKHARGMNVVMAYEMLEQPENITKDSMDLARSLGWCVEMAYFCLIDDIMDESTTRRGKPTWHTLPEVGNSAPNDSVILYSIMLYVMRKQFGEGPNYREMVDVISENLLYSSFGQYLDCKTTDLSQFTIERHRTIIKFKTAYYTYHLPTTLGLLLADYKVNEDTKKRMQDVALEIGVLFQIQDDYLDAFGDEFITGKLGRDIQEGKCTWLAVNALQRCSPAQHVVFKACYGSEEPAHIERCKQLYCDLKLPELYKEVESRYYDDILEMIRELPTNELRNLFHGLLGITYQRKK